MSNQLLCAHLWMLASFFATVPSSLIMIGIAIILVAADLVNRKAIRDAGAGK